MTDPTFAGLVRALLRDVATSNPDATPAELLDAIAARVEEPKLKPHRVRLPSSAFVDLPDATVTTPADETDPRPKGTKVSGRRYDGPVDCPDCSRGLASRDGDLICSRLDRNLKLAGDGGIVACGVPSDG